MVILTKPKCSKPREILLLMYGNQKFQKCAKICHTSQTGIEHRSDRLDLSKSKSSPLDLSSLFIGFQSHLPDVSGIGLD
jgi:hypothetical protein